MLYLAGAIDSPNPPYDAVKDFTHVTLLAENLGQALVVNPSLPVKSVQELVARGRASSRPSSATAKLSYGQAQLRPSSATARPILSTCAGLSWPSGIDWQRWVGPDLKVRAVVVAVISIPIESVFTHPKDDLQRAFLAVDVGKANVGLMK